MGIRNECGSRSAKIETRLAFTRENYRMMRELLCLFLHCHSVYAQATSESDLKLSVILPFS